MTKDHATQQQVLPRAGDVAIHSLVADDILERAELGKKKYGHYLESHNGRRALVDLYQELLDAACYIKQELLEQDSMSDDIMNVLDLTNRYINGVTDEGFISDLREAINKPFIQKLLKEYLFNSNNIN